MASRPIPPSAESCVATIPAPPAKGSEGTGVGNVLQEFQTAALLRARRTSASCSYILWEQRHAKKQFRAAARTQLGQTTRTLDARGGIRDSASSDARQVDQPHSVQ